VVQDHRRKLTEAKMKLDLTVVSDFLCPWCYLGTLRLAEALLQLKRSEFADVQVSIRLWPHLLMSEVLSDDKALISKRKMYLRKFNGNKVRVEEMERSFQEMLSPFAEGGYSLEGNVGSTMKAHCLSEWAFQEFGPLAQFALALELFQQFHRFGKNLAENTVLLEAVERVSALDKGEANKVLSENLFLAEVQEKLSSTQDSLGLLTFAGGVPHIVAKSGPITFEIAGCQDTQYFTQILKKIASKAEEKDTLEANL